MQPNDEEWTGWKANRRDILAVLKKPGLRLRSLLFLFIGIELTQGIMLAIFLFLNQRVLLDLATYLNPPIHEQVTRYSTILSLVVMIVFVVQILWSYFVLVSFEHRVLSPMEIIRNYIAELKKGNYEFSRKLRSKDELKPIMDDLHELAKVLKEKSR